MNSLVKINGDEITGEIKITLWEYYTKSDIVLANLHTTSDNELLETAGMIYIEAKKDGRELKLRDRAEMTIKFKSENDDKLEEMEIFLGEKHNNQINWVQQDNPLTMIAQTESVAIIEGDIYHGYDSAEVAKLKEVEDLIFKSTNLGWINCDRFYKFDNKTDLIVQVDTVYRPVLRLVFKNINAIMPGYYSKDQKVIFNGLPVGQKATLIGLSMVNDEPYFASKDIRISNNHQENIKLIQTTMTALKQDLKKLN